VKAERLHRLQQVSKAAAQRYTARLLGTVERVLAETRSKLSGLMTGTSDRYLQVEFAAPNSLIGQLVAVRLIDLTPDGVLGELTTA
jgi:tRNA A37 methylthiotransferase MiaB